MPKLDLTKLSSRELDQLFDRRNVDRYLAKGMISQKDVDDHLAKLPDQEKEITGFEPKQLAVNDEKIVIKDWSNKARNVKG